MQLQEQIALAPYTTLRVGGRAQFFCAVTSEAELLEAQQFAQQRGMPVFVLGGGSNLLVGDSGFAGLVIRMAISGITREGDRVRAGAGVVWDGLVQYAVHEGLAGVECLAGIPGTVGATPVQNVGAYGQEVSQTITRVRALRRSTQDFVWLTREQCGFDYRTSVFNTSQKDQWVITEVEFQLHANGVPTLKYAELAKAFEGQRRPSLQEVVAVVKRIRAGKGMVTASPDADGQYPAAIEADTRSAGSFFRNAIVPTAVYEQIATQFDAVPHWPAGDGLIKLPAAWLIEQAGVTKGWTVPESSGLAGISTRHTLALTNRGHATATEMKALRDAVVERVRLRFGITLEQEPVSVGE